MILKQANKYFEEAQLISMSGCDNIKMNFAKLSMFSKFGVTFIIL